jgi:hypothetical protein
LNLYLRIYMCLQFRSCCLYLNSCYGSEERLKNVTYFFHKFFIVTWFHMMSLFTRTYLRRCTRTCFVTLAQQSSVGVDRRC